jgi:hypothetical protein
MGVASRTAIRPVIFSVPLAAAAKADKPLAAAAKGAEKITGLIAALEAVPLAAPVKAAKAKAAIVPA